MVVITNEVRLKSISYCKGGGTNESEPELVESTPNNSSL